MPNAYRTDADAGTGDLPDADAIAEIREMVAFIVGRCGELGVRRALLFAAESLCIGPRRARGYYHGEIRAVPEDELAQCRVAFLGFVRQQRHELDERIRGALGRAA